MCSKEERIKAAKAGKETKETKKARDSVRIEKAREQGKRKNEGTTTTD